MIPLSARTVAGMKRAYENTLDGTCEVYRKTMSNTATGRTSTFTKLDVDDITVFNLRIDPEITDEKLKNYLIEKGASATLSLSLSAPDLEPEDEVSVIAEDEEIERYVIKGRHADRSGLSFDKVYNGVKL